MLRTSILACALTCVLLTGACAETAIERGSYLVNTINITSHPIAGIGARSDAEIDHAIRQGITRDGHALKRPMAFAFDAGLKDADLRDIIAYLRTVPPLE